MIRCVRSDEGDTFVPAGHHGVLNRMIAGRSPDGVPEVSIWEGDFEPGGEADLHVHENAVQVYVILSGTFTAGGPSTVWSLARGDALVIPAGDEHLIRCEGPGTATVLVITAPAAR